MKPHRFASTRWSRTALALFGSAALVTAQEPQGSQEPKLTPEVFRDAGPAPTAQAIDMRGQEGPLTVFELPPDERNDEVYRYDKASEELGTFPQEFLGNPYFLGFAKNLYRPPAGERVDPLLVQRLVQAQTNGEQIAQTWAFVMLEGRDTAEKRDRIASLGVKLLRYHPNNCYSARIPLDRLIELSEMPEVHWVGYPRLSQKMHFNLRAGLEQGWLWGEIPVWVNLYESDLGPASVKVAGPAPVETDPGGILREGSPEAAGYEWLTNSPLLERLKELGFKPKRYHENIDAYEGSIDIAALDRVISLEKVQHVEWSPLLEAGHDRHIPQVGQDYQRESVRVLTNTIGIADSGFNVSHTDIGIWGIGWSYWGAGCAVGNPAVWCDEAGEGYHGSHTLGSILGNGASNSIYRGSSPYNARTSAQRLFAVKGYTYSAFQHYRNSYTDGSNVTSPRPFLSSHSWRSGGCGGTPQMALNWIGSESGARLTDDEVYQYNQLYVFCGGNEGDCAGGCRVAGTMGIPSVAKNALTVGAVWDDVTSEGEVGVATCFSSNGPCGDGRWKPNVVAPGCNTTSVDGGTNTGYSSKCGCSMATPITAGVLSGAAEKYGWNWSSMARAWAMGTAVTWQDDGSAGFISTTHLNRYGMGRISAVKAQEGGGSYPWVRSWAGSTITNETDTMDISVGSGCTRLIVVLTWDDPQSSSGASRAIVNDIDLWIDQEPFSASGNAGEWASTSVVQSVEHEVINNPAAGNYRIKVYPYANTTSGLRWGLFTIAIYGDTTPTGGLAAAVSDSYIQPGQNISVAVTADTDAYIATNVYLDKGTHTGFTQTAAETTLKDGQIIATNFSDTTLGDIVRIGNSARTATYTFNASSTTDAVRTLNWQARSDNWGTRNVSATVTVDGTPPPTVSNFASTSHTVNAWSNNRSISFAWAQAADNLSGVDGYGEFWAASSPTGVGAIWDFGVSTSRTIDVGADWNAVYYGLRTVDRSGNWSGEVTVGPYRIDTVLPALPANLRSTSHTINVWTSDSTIDLAWNAATDDRSGVDGFGESWGTAPGVVVANSKDFEETTLARTLSRPDGATYYALKTVDNAGNWTGGTTEVGPFLIDTTAPSAVTGLTSPTHTVGVWSTNGSITINWTAAGDALSGLAGYDTLIDGSPSTDPAGAIDTPAGVVTTTRSPGSTATGFYFHIRPRDNAGNWGTTAHFGPILVDNVAPIGPTNFRSTSHTVNTWSNVATAQLAFNAAADGHSGVAGLHVTTDLNPASVPGGPTNLPGNATTATQTLFTSTSGWYHHIRARDVAGNWGTVQHIGPFLVDRQIPTGSVTIDSGNSEAVSLNVNLTLAAADAVSGLQTNSIRLRNDGGSFSAWMPFAANMAWNLTNNGGSSATGTRRVTMEVRDVAGNVLSVSDTIYYYVPVSYFGSSCAGSLGQPSFLVSGIPGLGRSVSFVTGNTAAPLGALYLGVSNTTWGGIPLPLDLGFLNPNSTGCLLNVSLDLTVYSGPRAPVNINVPIDGTIVGIPLFYQWHLFGDPSGKLVVTTRGARVVASDI